jgi:DNA polymerase III alpha subunit
MSMGFAGYFLIVVDFISYAKRRTSRSGRGAARLRGLAAWSLGITASIRSSTTSSSAF